MQDQLNDDVRKAFSPTVQRTLNTVKKAKSNLKRVQKSKPRIVAEVAGKLTAEASGIPGLYRAAKAIAKGEKSRGVIKAAEAPPYNGYKYVKRKKKGNRGL